VAKGELGKIDGLAVVGDHDDADVADAKHHRGAEVALDPPPIGPYRAVGDEPTVSQDMSLAE
jgi:hypothetical protein